MKEKKVLYVASCFGHGIGGHYYSLRTTAESMSRVADVYIMTIGTVSCPVFHDCSNYISIMTLFPSLSAFRQAINFIRKNKINVIHSFDEHGYFFARIISNIEKIDILHTKCGGLVPGRYYPFMDNIVVYGEEDKAYFTDHRKFKKTRINLIPNRAKKARQDYESIAELKSALDDDRLTFMRIARFSGLHKNSIEGSIELIKRLSALGKKVQLVVIGVVQDKNIFEQISSNAPDNVYFITDSKYTTNASRLLDLADFVIGTGRGAMEAIVQGKILLSPIKDQYIPALVDSNNIKTFLGFNFSSRTVLSEGELEASFNRLTQMTQDNNKAPEYDSEMRVFSDENFDIDNAIPKFSKLYSSIKPARLMPLDCFLHFLKVARFFRINAMQDSEKQAISLQKKG